MPTTTTVHHPLDHFLAGQVGGTLGVLAGQPFDTLKVLMQTKKRKRMARSISRIQREVPRRPSWIHKSNIITKRPRYTSVMNALLDVYASQGLRGFYRGVAYPILATGTQKSMAFGVSSFVLERLTRRRNKFQGENLLQRRDTERRRRLRRRPHLIDLTMAGVAAGVTNTLFCTPVDQLKIAQQIRSKTQLSFVETG